MEESKSAESWSLSLLQGSCKTVVTSPTRLLEPAAV